MYRTLKLFVGTTIIIILAMLSATVVKARGPQKYEPSEALSIEPAPIVACWSETYECYVHKNLVDGICSRCHQAVMPQYGFTDDDIYLLTQLLCGNSSTYGDGEYDFDWDLYLGTEPNQEEISKVLCTVMNRIRSGEYDNHVRDVVLQPHQFVVFPKNLKSTPSDKAIAVVREWCEKYDNWHHEIETIPRDHIYFVAGPNNGNITMSTWD